MFGLQRKVTHLIQSGSETDQDSTTYNKQTVVIKSVRHFRLENERDVLKRFQDRTPYIRPLLDQIVDPLDSPAIVLRHLNDHLLNASASQISEAEVLKEDRDFILKIMKLDPRDRPSAEELLEDEWFHIN